MLAPGSHPRFVTKYEVLKLLQERKEQRRLTNNKFATKQTRWLEGKVRDCRQSRWTLAAAVTTCPVSWVQIITNLTAMGTTKSETDESMQAWRAALPPSLSLKHQLQLLDLRPKNVVGAYVVSHPAAAAWSVARNSARVAAVCSHAAALCASGGLEWLAVCSNACGVVCVCCVIDAGVGRERAVSGGH
jgi:hypothetical protein